MSRAIWSAAPRGASAGNPGSRSCSCSYSPPALPPISGLTCSIPSGTSCQTLPWWILAAKRRSGLARDPRSRGHWQAGSYPSKSGWTSGASPELLRTVPGVLTLRDRLESFEHNLFDRRRPFSVGSDHSRPNAARTAGVRSAHPLPWRRVSIIRRLRTLPSSGVGQRHNRVERRYGRQTTGAGSWRSGASGLEALPG